MLKYVQLCITDREKERICVKLDARMCKKKKSQNHLDFDAELSRTDRERLNYVLKKERGRQRKRNLLLLLVNRRTYLPSSVCIQSDTVRDLMSDSWREI